MSAHMAKPSRDRRYQSDLAVGALQEHLDRLDAPPRDRARTKGAVFMLGGPHLLEVEHSHVPWTVRIQCELPRPEYAGRAVYVGTGDEAEDVEYLRFVQTVGRIGIRACCRLQCDVMLAEGGDSPATVRALAFLEQSDLIWFGDTGPPEKVWRAIEKAPGDVPERLRWRHQHGAVLVGVGQGAMLVGAHGWEHIEIVRAPDDDRHEVYQELDDPKERTLFSPLGAVKAVIFVEAEEVKVEVKVEEVEAQGEEINKVLPQKKKTRKEQHRKEFNLVLVQVQV